MVSMLYLLRRTMISATADPPQVDRPDCWRNSKRPSYCERSIQRASGPAEHGAPSKAMRHLAVFALFLSAALSICAPHTARASTAMWGAVPKSPYDQLDRLTSATASSVTQGWTYDADGNRTADTGTSASTYSISAASNQITEITGALNRTYGYDASGNILTDTDITATYNGAGRLKSEANSSGSTSFVYNGLGQMIEASGAAGAIVYAYDKTGHLVGEYDGSGNLIQETVWLGDIPVATIQPSGSSVAIYYVISDQLNTPREVIQSSDNALMWSWFSGPFGSDAPNTNPQGAGAFTYDLRFPGQVAGAWGSTSQNDNRDYDPAVGRYVEPDPIGQHFYFSLSIFPGVSVLHRGYWNRLYVYSDDEPMSLEDPTGLGFFGWVLDLFKERAPEADAEATTKSIAIGLAALCVTEHCGQQRDSLELYGDCADDLSRWEKQQGPELVGFLDGLSDTSENGLLTDCAELCARGIQAGHCCKGGKQ